MHPNISGYQTEFLEGLGVYRRGYSPEGCCGKGSVVYSSRDLQDRLAMAGYEGAALRGYFEGRVALTVRSMFSLAQAALGSWEDRTPQVWMENTFSLGPDS